MADLQNLLFIKKTMTNQTEIKHTSPTRTQIEAAFAAFYRAKKEHDELKKSRNKMEKDELNEVEGYETQVEKMNTIKETIDEMIEIAEDRVTNDKDYQELGVAMLNATKKLMEKKEALAIALSGDTPAPISVTFAADDGDHLAWIESGKKIMIDDKQLKLNF